MYSCGFAAQSNIYTLCSVLDNEEVYDKDFDNKREAVEAQKIVGGEIYKTVVAEPLKNAIHNVGAMLENIRERTGATSHRVYLTGKDNFRDSLVDDYKANRPPTKPVHYEAIKNYLVEVWGAEIIDGQEADDAMAIDHMRHMYQSDTRSIICTIDKDLTGVPGLHYNWKWDSICDVSSHEALIFFYYQMLKGDSTDNIAGLFRHTGKRLTKAIIFGLLDCEYEEDMWRYVIAQYGKDFPREKLITTARLLYMRREDNEDWEAPPLEEEEESGSEVHGEVQPSGEDGGQEEVQA